MTDAITGLDRLLTPRSGLVGWVQEMAALTRPARVHWCGGSQSEREWLTGLLVGQGALAPLNPELRPGSFAERSDPADAARVEDRTFICWQREDDAGPTSNWIAPAQMRAVLARLFDGCMTGRTMYVILLCMGPPGEPISQLGAQVTDSAYVALSMQVMSRPGIAVLDRFDEDEFFVQCVHSVGAPLAPGQADVPWPCNKIRYISYFPETREIWSFGSGYGPSSLLGKDCFALRIAR